MLQGAGGGDPDGTPDGAQSNESPEMQEEEIRTSCEPTRGPRDATWTSARSPKAAGIRRLINFRNILEEPEPDLGDVNNPDPQDPTGGNSKCCRRLPDGTIIPCTLDDLRNIPIQQRVRWSPDFTSRGRTCGSTGSR